MFIAVKPAIDPAPIELSPIDVLSLVQEYVVTPPVFCVVNTVGSKTSSLQTTTLLIGSTCAVGFTVMTKVFADPELLFPPFSKPGVTTTVVTMGLVPVLTAVNPISLEPEFSNPVVGSVFVHV